MKSISILGATGSIGTQTLEVMRSNSEKYTLIGASANSNYNKMIQIINEFKPKFVALMDDLAYHNVKTYCKDNNLNIEVIHGLEGLNTIASCDEADIVVTSVVGVIGLIPTLMAINSGKNIALANKETLVAAGNIVMEAARKNKVRILPVDSEHGAIFQCIQGNDKNNIEKILLTASGGPFRGKKRTELINITPQDALKHPKWNMGEKISIDSSTLMNKGLEVIEAHWLFEVSYDKIEVVIHPQSIIHSMVEYNDGSVIAQLANPDMKLPIQYALNYPERFNSVIPRLDFYELNSLTFEKPDTETFRCLKLAYEAGKTGGNMPTIMNSANEIAVNLFLENRIKYLEIEKIIEECMNKFEYIRTPNIDDIIYTDKNVKKYVRNKYCK